MHLKAPEQPFGTRKASAVPPQAASPRSSPSVPRIATSATSERALSLHTQMLISLRPLPQGSQARRGLAVLPLHKAGARGRRAQPAPAAAGAATPPSRLHQRYFKSLGPRSQKRDQPSFDLHEQFAVPGVSSVGHHQLPIFTTQPQCFHTLLSRGLIWFFFFSISARVVLPSPPDSFCGKLIPHRVIKLWFLKDERVP